MRFLRYALLCVLFDAVFAVVALRWSLSHWVFVGVAGESVAFRVSEIWRLLSEKT